MPTDIPAIRVYLPPDLYAAVLEAAGGKQKMSAYLRALAAEKHNITVHITHGGNRHKQEKQS